MGDGAMADNVPQKKCTFDEFFIHVYLPHAQMRKRSWLLDKRLARNHLSAYFGHRRMNKISNGDIEIWLGTLRANGLAPSTCNRILAVLKSVFSLAEKLAYIKMGESPGRAVRPFKVFTRCERFLTKSEGQELMNHLRQTPGLQSKIIQLLLLTGARKSEIMQARWSNLDMERRILTVPVAKSGRPRYIYLSEEAVGIFASLERIEGNPWIFPGRKKDKPLSNLHHFWNKTRISLGLVGVRLHDLRHSFASYLVGKGHTLYEVQQLLGHMEPRTTMRYAHFGHAPLLEAAAAIAQIFAAIDETDEETGQACTARRRGSQCCAGCCARHGRCEKKRIRLH